MGYYTIEGHHVFMTHERENLARDNALSAKDALFRVRTAFNSPERREADTLIYNYLESLHKADPNGFVQDWVTLAFDAEQSATYGWDLLYDYCWDRKRGHSTFYGCAVGRGGAGTIRVPAWRPRVGSSGRRRRACRGRCSFATPVVRPLFVAG